MLRRPASPAEASHYITVQPMQDRCVAYRLSDRKHPQVALQVQSVCVSSCRLHDNLFVWLERFYADDWFTATLRTGVRTCVVDEASDVVEKTWNATGYFTTDS